MCVCLRLLQLGIFNGDAVLLKGKKRKDTVCIALVEEGLEDASIRMSKVFYASRGFVSVGPFFFVNPLRTALPFRGTNYLKLES